MEWKTIETVPGDGVYIVYNGEYVREACLWRGEWSHYSDEYDMDTYPTHWMPLPDPPTN